MEADEREKSTVCIGRREVDSLFQGDFHSLFNSERRGG